MDLLRAAFAIPLLCYILPVCDGPITCCALVPSNIHCSLDHVWMADSTNHIYVHSLQVGEWRTAYRKFAVPSQVKDMCCIGNYVFLGMVDGSVLKCANKHGEYYIILMAE